MSTLKQAIHDYLALRRALGFKLKKHSRFLDEFAAFLDRTGTSHITSHLALQWATEPQHIRQSEWATRLSVVRGFARHWSATDPATEIPPEALLPYRPSRAKPDSQRHPDSTKTHQQVSYFHGPSSRGRPEILSSIL